MNTTLSQRIQEIIASGYTQTDLSRAAGVTKGTSNQWIDGKIKSIKLEYAQGIQTLTGFHANWIVTGKGDKKADAFKPDYHLINAEQTELATGKIEYWDARGSCGGGIHNYEQMPKGHLVKEASFFSKYNLKPENAFAIYADGNSMAEFIVDGDIVIFDKSKTTPISGQIFAIEHPDGLRIKVLRRAIDGSWTLISKNTDKATYPDEIIPPGHTELLKIHGQFVYRQGG